MRCVALHRYVKSGFHPGKCHHLRGEGPRALEQSGERRAEGAELSAEQRSSCSAPRGRWELPGEPLRELDLGSRAAEADAARLFGGLGRLRPQLLRHPPQLSLSRSLSLSFWLRCSLQLRRDSINWTIAAASCDQARCFASALRLSNRQPRPCSGLCLCLEVSTATLSRSSDHYCAV